MLFRQSEMNMDLTQYWKDYFNMVGFAPRFNISDFAADQNLQGKQIRLNNMVQRIRTMCDLGSIQYKLEPNYNR